MRPPRAAVAVVLAATATLSTGCGLDPTNVTGAVTSRHMQYDAATKAWDFYLTIRTDGHQKNYRVLWHIYRACPPGSTYPACKQ